MNKTTVNFPTPVKIGDKEVTEIEVRKPKAGELRGLKTMDILQMDIAAHRQLIPRVCVDVTANIFDELEPENLTAIQSAVVNFFVSADV